MIDECRRSSLIHIPAERDLTIYMDKRELVTLMTMGGHLELLVLDYLRNQRLIRDIGELESIQVDWDVGGGCRGNQKWY